MTIQQEMSVEYHKENIKLSILEFIRNRNNHIQYNDILNHIKENSKHPKSSTDVINVIYDLIVERVITPGKSDAIASWPWLHVTDKDKLEKTIRELSKGE